MILITLTVVVIVIFVAVLATFLFAIGALLKRVADNLDNCAESVKTVAYQAEVIGPGIERINETGGTVVGALPLLCEAAEQIGIAKSAPYVDPSENSYSAPSYSAPATVTAPAPAAASPAPAAAPVAVAVPAATPRGVGYLDGTGGNIGYLDA